MNKKIIGIYLAAGKSSRFGSNKLTMPFGTSSLGSVALKAILNSQLDHTIVIVRENDGLHWLRPEYVKNERIDIVTCQDAFRGQSSSLKCGVRVAVKMNVDAAIIFLADQPFITKELINELIQQYVKQDTLPFICAGPTRNICPPVLINESIFHQFEQLKGDVGAKRMLHNKKELGMFMECENPIYFFDIDTKEDYEQARLMLKSYNSFHDSFL